MSNRNKTKSPSVSYEGFGGINKTSDHRSVSTAKEIVNFAVLKNGSLKKRCGTRMITETDGTIRAIHTPIIDGKQALFILSKNTVYGVHTEKGNNFGEKYSLGTIPSSENDSIFFTFDGSTYIADGENIYVFNKESNNYSPVTGYVPLVGKDWPNNYVGPPNEQRNILNNHARITYAISDPVSIYLCTGDIAASIEAVYHNGKRVSEDKYSIGDIFNTINLSGMAAGDRVEVYFTYRDGKYGSLEDLKTSMCAAIFGGTDNNRIMLSGTGNSSSVFCSKPVSKADLGESQKIYPESNGLYLPDNFEISIGNGSGEVQSVLRHHNNILIFTDSELWVASPEDDYSGKINAYSVNSEIGVSVKNGTFLAGNDPVSLGHHSIWLWKNESGTSRKYAAIKLSADIDEELNRIGISNCGIFYSKEKNELWVNSRISDEIWIYNFDSSAWYKFSGISADKLFELDGTVAFTKENRIFVFDESLNTDIDEYGNEHMIDAYYLTNDLDFNSPRLKNVSAIELSADLCDQDVNISFEDVNGIFKGIKIRDTSGNKHSYLRKYVPSRRFSSTSIRIRTSAPAPQMIHSLKVITR